MSAERGSPSSLTGKLKSIGANLSSFRAWILEQIQYRPYLFRVTVLAEMSIQYQKLRPKCSEAFYKSLGAMKNYLQQSDKSTEFQIMIKTNEAEAGGLEQAQGSNLMKANI